MKEYLQVTPMLNYDSNVIQQLVENRKWKDKNEFQKILEIYNFVRDEIKFGYNVDDTIKASRVLEDSYGQCNTKGTLFMAPSKSIARNCLH